jgi:hypothetical protein
MCGNAGRVRKFATLASADVQRHGVSSPGTLSALPTGLRAAGAIVRLRLPVMIPPRQRLGIKGDAYRIFGEFAAGEVRGEFALGHVVDLQLHLVLVGIEEVHRSVGP